MTLLTLSAISKTFGGVRALSGVDFQLRAGEVHALIGENGAGKSTLIKVITGVHTPDAGTIELHGQPLVDNRPSVARSLGIAAIYQQPALFPELTVAENIAVRIEPPRAWRLIAWRQRRRAAKAVLARVGARIHPDALVKELSMPQQQLVEIASALGANVKVLILDEPTASLSDREVDNLFSVIRQLRSQGIGMIYVSHRLEELPQVADRVTVLRDGTYVATRDMTQVDRAELIRLMAGRPLEALFPKTVVPIGDVVLQTKSLGCSRLGVSDINLDVRAGEILGLAGLVGAGRTELARVLFGLERATAGEVCMHGRPLTIRSPSDAIAQRIAYVPEDRRRHGVILDLSVSSNTSLAVLDRLAKGTMIDFARERDLASHYVQQLGTKTASIDHPVSNLSGGNQQKVSLARWLATEPQVLILDEPTQGVDVGAKAEIHRLICALAGRGMAIILISSELPEVLGMSDRIAVMHAGRVMDVLDRADATQERVLQLALGHTSAEKVA